MKKIIALLLALSAAFCLVSCGKKNDPADEKPDPAKQLAAFAAAVSDEDPSRATLSVRVSSPLGELDSVYQIAFTGEDAATVTYTEEYFVTPVEEAIKLGKTKDTRTGIANYKNGSVAVDGKNVSVAAITAYDFDFKLSLFEDLTIEGNNLNATVTVDNTESVFGVAFPSDVAFTCTKNDTRITAMTFSYTDNGASVVVSCAVS